MTNHVIIVSAIVTNNTQRAVTSLLDAMRVPATMRKRFLSLPQTRTVTGQKSN